MKSVEQVPLFMLVFIAVSILPLFGQNYALYFDGVDDYVEVPDNPSLDLSDELTIETWFNWISSGDEWHAIVSKGPTDENYALYINRTDRFFHFQNNF